MRLASLVMALNLLTAIPATSQGFAALLARGDSLEQQKRWVEAARAYEAAYLASGFDPTGLALAASDAARGKDVALAVNYVRRAIDEGFIRQEIFDKDSAYHPLRKDPRWTAEMARLKARIARINQPLRDELISLANRDQANRRGFDEIMNRTGSRSRQADSAGRALLAADAPLQARLRAIVTQYGWPTRRLVGDDGAHAAWLVLQHAPSDYQRTMLPRVLAAAAAKDARAGDAALLEDRVLRGQGKPQKYGSQLSWPPTGGRPTLDPIENEACVDARRRTVGLEPLAVYVKQFGAEYVAKGRC